jgi:uncharacterized protein DUF839
MRKALLAALVAMFAVLTSTAIAAPGAETGPSSSQSPYLIRTTPGIVTKSILTTGDSVNLKPNGTDPYRMVGIPDGLGAFDNGDGTFTVLMNHELSTSQGIARAHGAQGAFVSKWTIRKSDLTVLHGEDLIQRLHTWNGSDWVISNTNAAPAQINRLCSADLAPISAFYNADTGKGYNGRIFLDGEEGTDVGRPFAHVVATGDSWELTPWVGNVAYENLLANPSTGDDTVVMTTDDGSAAAGNQVYLYLGTKKDTGNPAQKAGLTNGKLYGLKVDGVAQWEYLKTNWTVGEQHPVEFVDVSGNPGSATQLEADSQAGGVTNFQRPEDGSWDPNNPNDFYFVTTSSLGPIPAENRTGQTRLWRVRFEDPADPSAGATIKLLVSGPVGTADSSGGTQSADSPGPQMFDNITVNRQGQVILLEDVGGNAYLGGVWVYNIGTGSLTKVARHDPDRFTPGVPGFLTKDEEASGVIPAPFLGKGWYLVDVQAHYTIGGELVQGGQLLALMIPPAKPLG